MSHDPSFTAEDFLRAESVCEHLAKNLEITFQTHGEEMVHPQAVRHFKKREALQIVRLMLIDRAEHLEHP